MNSNDIILTQTSCGCPEQYDAFYAGVQIGYLRLRHGYFRVDFPECGCETIYDTWKVKGDGIFTDDKRDRYLLIAKQRLLEKLIEEGLT